MSAFDSYVTIWTRPCGTGFESQNCAPSPGTSTWDASPVLERRLTEIDSLTALAEAEPGNSARAQAVSVALDAWYFDVQQLRRTARRMKR